MKLFTKALISGAVALAVSTSLVQASQPAKSQKHAEYVTETRQAIFTLLGSNMGALGAMAKGKIPVNADVAEKNATRINQLSLMIADYTRTDTSTFKVKTEALNVIWTKSDEFAKSIERLTLASANLQVAAKSKDEAAIKKAIGGVGKSCGGCHDVFKQDD